MPAAERIIVIGGSMGAYDVVRTLCRALPPALKAAVCIVLHVRPDSRNAFAASLDHAGDLPVNTAKDSDPLEGGHIYVAPGDHHLLIIDNNLRLGRGPRENMSRPAIDPLFRSAAVSHGPRVIAVLLSGYLNDGAAGLAAVRQCGGVTVVQNPADAKAPDMPLNALEAVEVDYRCDAADMPSTLVRLLDGPAGEALPVPPELTLEVEIALGRPCDSEMMKRLADPSVFSCPTCGGVLSKVRAAGPARYRCQVGHGFTAEILNNEQEDTAEEALRVALRIVEERIALLHTMVANDTRNARHRSAQMYGERLTEYERNAETIRASLMKRDLP